MDHYNIMTITYRCVATVGIKGLKNWTSSPHKHSSTLSYVKLLHSEQSPTVWVKKIRPLRTWHFSFFHKRLKIFNQFFTHLLYVPIFARLQICIQLYPTLTKLCHIKHDCLVHVICSKCLPSAETHAFRRLRKSLTALLIVVCGKLL